jgi:hypothetical protein
VILNHDGKLDLAVGNCTGGRGPNLYSDVAVLLGNGDGTFQKAVNYTNDGRVTSLVAGDFTGSGNLDLAVDSSHLSPLSGCWQETETVALNLRHPFFSQARPCLP